MNTQSEFNSQDLVFRMLDGAHKGALLPVSSRKCLMGDNIGSEEEHSSHLVILRSEDGAAIKGHGTEVFVNGKAISTDWLKQGDEIQFGQTRIEVVQVGMFTEQESIETPIPTAATVETTEETTRDSPSNGPNQEEEKLQESPPLPMTSEDVDNRVDVLTNALSSLSSTLDEKPEAPESVPTEAIADVSPQEATAQEQIYSPLDHLQSTEESVELPSVPAIASSVQSVEAVQEMPAVEATQAENKSPEPEIVKSQQVVEPQPVVEAETTADPQPVVESHPVAETQTENHVDSEAAEREAELARVFAKLGVDSSDDGATQETTQVSVAAQSCCQTQLENEAGDSHECNDPCESSATCSSELVAAINDSEANHTGAVSEPIVGLTPLSELSKQFRTGFGEAPIADSEFKPSEAIACHDLDTTSNKPVAEMPLEQVQPAVESTEEMPEEQTQAFVDSGLPTAEPFEADSNEESEQAAQFEEQAANPKESATCSETPALSEDSVVVEKPAKPDHSAEQRLHDVFSKLREQPSDDNEDETSQLQSEQEEPVAEVPSEPTKEPGNESVADLLARMQAEGQLNDFQAPSEEAEPASQPAPVETPVVPEPVSDIPVTEETGGDEDTSVQDYMNRLLGRDSEEVTKQKDEEEERAAAAAIAAEKAKRAEPVQILTASEYKPSKSAPEKTKNLDAFRELANQNNRVALAKSNSQRVKAVALTNFGIMTLGVLLSIYLFLTAGGETTNMAIAGLTLVLSLGLGAFAGKSYLKLKSDLAG